MTFITVPQAVEEIKRGKPLIILDNERECEADFYLPAQLITPEHIMTMIRYGGGILLAALTQEQATRLDIPLMVPLKRNTETTQLNVTISVNAKHGITTGVSAFDRARTISLLANPEAKPETFTRPGHVSCVIAKPGGLLQRQGHTEAAVDLSRLAGFYPAGVLCEIIHDDGKMAQASELEQLSRKLEIPIILLKDIITYIQRHPLPDISEVNLTKKTQATLPTPYGTFTMSIYHSLSENDDYIVLSMGNTTRQPILTRIHSQCFTGDTLFSLRCDCGEQLQQSMEKIAENRNGVILYLNQEGRGIGLRNKIKAYALQEEGLDTVEANQVLGFTADERNYKIAAELLKDLGINSIMLLTNNPDKIEQLTKEGITIAKRIALTIKPNSSNKKYLKTKKEKLGHLL